MAAGRDHGSEPDSGSEAERAAAGGKERAQRQDGQPDMGGLPDGYAPADDVQPDFLHAGLADATGLPPHGPLFEAVMGAAGTCLDGGTPASGQYNDRRSEFHFAARFAPGQAVTQRRRDSIRGGGGGREDSGAERAIFDRADGGFAARTDGDVSAGVGTAERESVRLLGPGDGGTASFGRARR